LRHTATCGANPQLHLLGRVLVGTALGVAVPPPPQSNTKQPFLGLQPVTALRVAVHWNRG
jgi:hypothetical protein